MPTPKRSPRKHPSNRTIPTARAQWEHILRNISKDEVPLDLVGSIVIRLFDGGNVPVDIDELRKEGFSSTEIERLVSERINEHSTNLTDVDFFINIDSVASYIQPITDELLKGV